MFKKWIGGYSIKKMVEMDGWCLVFCALTQNKVIWDYN